MLHFYKLIGKKPVPCNVLDWAIEFEKDRTVAKTKLGDILISTVFLRVNHSFLDNASPLLFEIMIFRFNHEEDQGAEEEKCERYSTWDQAEAGHRAMVEKIRKRKYTQSKTIK
jgi:hypothetical protein